MTQSTTVPPARVTPVDCETAVRRLWDYLDGRLTEIARDEVEAHLATCALCPPHFEFAIQMRTALAASAEPPLEAADDAHLRERVRKALAGLGRVAERSRPGEAND
ncbi:MAG TPA: anti-sigma factor [Gemmatimonadaceae bacterium]